MPACRTIAAAVVFAVLGLFGRGQLRSFSGIDANGQDVEIRANAKTQHIHCPQETIQHLGAEHGTLVVHQGEHDGFLAKVLTQRGALAIGVGEFEIQGDLVAQFLVDADALL